MNLALFDFDGTITTSDSFSEFVRFAIRPARIPLACFVAGPIVLAYRLRLLGAPRVRPLVARAAFAGEPAQRLRELGARYASERLPLALRKRAIERIDWHRRRGDDVVVVSAALDVYLRPWCEAAGLRCICTELEERHGRMTGKYLHGDCSGIEKARRVLQQYSPAAYGDVYAYGDTSEDREMLAIALHKYFRWREVPPARPL